LTSIGLFSVKIGEIRGFNAQILPAKGAKLRIQENVRQAHQKTIGKPKIATKKAAR
jgi:hypothetical protein